MALLALMILAFGAILVARFPGTGGAVEAAWRAAPTGRPLGAPIGQRAGHDTGPEAPTADPTEAVGEHLWQDADARTRGNRRRRSAATYKVKRATRSAASRPNSARPGGPRRAQRHRGPSKPARRPGAEAALTRPRSALAASTERRHGPAGLDLGDARPAAGTRLAALEMDREEVADLGLERRRDAARRTAIALRASCASPRTGASTSSVARVDRLRNGSSRAAWRTSSL